MKTYSADQIKNIALCGHAGSGKTTAAEAMLYLSGKAERLGKVSDGTTVMDFDPEEKKRLCSVSTSLAYIDRDDVKINIIDTPGLFDFAGELAEGIRAADTAVIVLSGKSGVTVGAEKAFEAAEGKARMFFVSKLNSESADFHKVYNDLTVKFGTVVCPVVVPYVVERKVHSYINLIDEKAYTYENGKAMECELPPHERYDELRTILLEAVAESDDALMEKYFAEEPFTRDEIIGGLKKSVAEGKLCPVYSGSGQTLDGIDALLDAICEIAPSAADSEEIKANRSDKTAAIVFKTVIDPFVGKLSYFKVISGSVKSDSQLTDSRNQKTERIGKLMLVKGGKQEDVKEITCGDIGAASKLSSVLTGDTLCDVSAQKELDGVSFPKPGLAMAVKAADGGDDEKLAQGIIKLLDEDCTVEFKRNKETGEQIITGMGEQHLDVIASKVKQKFGVGMELTVPKVAYRETITKSAKAHGRHKKQSGGSGQFGDVWIEFEPCDSDELVFEERVVGGAVPKNFFPAVEKGLRDCMAKGTLAGYPAVGVKAVLYDGSYHSVDSNEAAFKTAATLAFKEGIPNAGPVIMEPVGSLVVLVDEGSMGDVIGEINKRRGRVLGMNAVGKLQEISAEVPIAETADFTTYLRSATGGRGSFTLTFERYEIAPAPIAQKIIENSNK